MPATYLLMIDFFVTLPFPLSQHLSANVYFTFIAFASNLVCAYDAPKQEYSTHLLSF